MIGEVDGSRWKWEKVEKGHLVGMWATCSSCWLFENLSARFNCETEFLIAKDVSNSENPQLNSNH